MRIKALTQKSWTMSVPVSCVCAEQSRNLPSSSAEFFNKEISKLSTTSGTDQIISSNLGLTEHEVGNISYCGKYYSPKCVTQFMKITMI